MNEVKERERYERGEGEREREQTRIIGIKILMRDPKKETHDILSTV